MKLTIKILILYNLILNIALADIVTKPISSMPSNPKQYNHNITSIAISPDGLYALSGSNDKVMKLWDISSGNEIRSFAGHTVDIMSVAFYPDGRYALSGSRDDSIKLWNLSTGAQIRQFSGHTNWINSIAISPDARYALSGSYDKTMKLWNLSTGIEVRSFSGHTDSIESVAISDNGRYVLSGSSDKTMKLWELSTGSEIRSFDGHTSDVISVAISPDSNYVLSGSHDNTMKLWKLSSGTEIRSFDGHTDSVSSVKFSPDGRYVLSGSWDNTIKLWDLSNGAEIHTFEGHNSSVRSVAFSPDGSYVYSGSYDKTIKKWYSGIPKNKPVTPPLDSFGQAIIIAAGGAQPSNTLYKYTNEYTQRFYRILKERGFQDENITYMNPQAPDIDLDGHLENDLLDYEFFDPELELKTAFEQAANNLAEQQQFILFIHGHARPNYFRIMDDYELSAIQLQELLAKLPADVQQILIIDSCYSGSFFDELKQPGRILISSADDQNQAWNNKYKSFTNTFLHSLRRGMTLTESFLQAEEIIIKDKQLFGEQRPWLDINGDGLYSQKEAEYSQKEAEKGSDTDVEKETIQVGKKGGPGDLPPEIHQVHPLIELEENITEANLWVRTTPGSDGIHKVRAVLINPKFSSGEYKGLETNFGREELELKYNEVAERYGIIYQGFKTAGMWRILYQAQSSKQGVWSDIVEGEVQAQGTNKPATIKMQVNQSRYKIIEPLRLDAVLNGETQADLYVAIIPPTGNFVTFKYPSIPSRVNEAQAYKANLKIEAKKTYPINLNLPNNSTQGKYQTCGVLVKLEAKPLELENWIDFHCVEFEVY